MNEYSDSNKILLCSPSGMSDAPFIFGVKLYLYDLVKQSKYLVDRSFKPFSGYGNSLGLGNNQIYYNEEFLGEGIEIYEKEVGNLIKRTQVLDYARIYFFDLKNMYYMHDEETDELRNDLYKRNQQSGQEEVLFEGELSNVLRLDHGKIYTWDSGRKEVLELSKDGKKVAGCPEVEWPLWIGYKNENEIMIIEPDKIVCYNKEKKEKSVIFL